MTKDRQSSAEKFTLQFGEADGEALGTETVISDAAFLDDQFMWNSATAMLQEVAKPAPIVEVVANTDAPTEPVAAEGEPEDEPARAVSGDVASQEPGDAQRSAEVVTDDVQPEYDDLDDDLDDEPMVVDERQAEIITKPDHEVANPAFVGAAVAGVAGVAAATVVADAPSAPALTREPPRFEKMPGTPSVIKTVPPLFLSEDDVPPVIAANAGTKTPWLVYGTLGLGVAVVAVAFTGMLLQLGKTPEAVGTVDVATTDGQVTAPEAPAVLNGASAVRVAGPETGAVDVQLQVLRLDVGPIIENDSLIIRPEVGQPISLVTPAAVLAAQPDLAFVPDLGETLPLSVAVETGGNFGVSQEEAAVVTLTSERIEIDLSNDVATDIATNGTALGSGAPSGIVDPQIVMASVPALSSAQAEPVESPQDVLAARALFDAISQASEDVATLDSAVLGAQAAADFEASVTVGSVTGEQAPKRGTFTALGRYDVASLSKVGFLPPSPLGVPLALVSAQAVAAPVEGTTDGVLATQSWTAVPEVAAPQAMASLRVPDLIVPSYRVDISRELIAAARAREAAERAQAASLIAQEAAARARLAEAAALQAKAAVRELSESVPADSDVAEVAPAAPAVIEAEAEVVVAQADTSQAEDAPASAGVAATAVLAPAQAEVEAEAPQADVASGSWVAGARWQADLGFDLVPVEQHGRSVLEIANLQGNSVLPGWVREGATIERVNDVAAVDEAAFWQGLVSRSDPSLSGEVSASLEMRLRADFDPRRAAIEVPVWRNVALSDGTEIMIKQDAGKWVATVVASDEADPTGLKPGDILLRDFITKSNLRDPLAVEAVFDAMDAAGQTEVEFAIMRDGELSNGKLGL